MSNHELYQRIYMRSLPGTFLGIAVSSVLAWFLSPILQPMAGWNLVIYLAAVGVMFLAVYAPTTIVVIRLARKRAGDQEA